jgi:uncharacterized protein YneF (UPF0154 family)
MEWLGISLAISLVLVVGYFVIVKYVDKELNDWKDR